MIIVILQAGGDNRLNTATMTLAHINKGWESLISGLQGVGSRPPVTKPSPQVPVTALAGAQSQIIEKWVSQDDKAQDTELQVSCKETMFQ